MTKNRLTTLNEVRKYMEASKSEEDWNNRCEVVKKANGGDYPAFWPALITKSAMDRVRKKHNW